MIFSIYSRRMMRNPKTTIIGIMASYVFFIGMIKKTNVLPAIPYQQYRQMSEYLGDGKCKWTPPTYEVPDVDFHKTLIAGFPSGDKRLTFVQMEALTGLPAKDEWDFENLGITNEPFIKCNYPHHEGIWGWEKEADQVVMVVRNIRRSLVEYHDILWDIGYAKTWDQANVFKQKLYAARPPKEDFLAWRDLRAMDEIKWYGWFIDYWMEEGLMRDMFTNKITTPEHWYMLMEPTGYTKEEMTYELIVGDAQVTATQDPHCVNDVSGGCFPVEIISAENLVVSETGPAENRKIAEVLLNKQGIGDNLIDEDAWECIWEELIINKKGLKTFIDREGLTERDYNFSEEMLDEMIAELTRLVTKYSLSEWSSKKVAQTLVDLLQSHLNYLITERDEVKAGVRKLKDNDFLGPKTRATREEEKSEEGLYW